MPDTRGKKFVLVAALLAAASYVLLHRARSWWEGEGRFSADGGAALGLADELVRHAVWETPWPVLAAPGELAGLERAALAPQGEFLCFAAREAGRGSELYLCELRDGRWGAARALEGLNSTAEECAPAFGGGYLYFASDRAGGAGGLDLWRAAFEDGALGAPEHLGGELASPADDTDPAPSFDGGELVFASDRGGDFELYERLPGARAGADRAARLELLGSPGAERDPCFGRDGRVLAFATDRGGDFDLWRSVYLKGRWRAPAPCEGLNSAQDERSPALDAAGFALYFARGPRGPSASATEPAAGAGLWQSRSREVFELPRRDWTAIDTAVLLSLLLLAAAAGLAQRWPALDLIYKCLLVSVLLHLLFLFLLQFVFLEGGAGAPREPERLRVRFVPSASARESLSERAGTLPEAHAAAAAEPERARLDAPAEEAVAPTPASPLALELPAGPAATAPERSSLDLAPARGAPSPSVELATPAAPRPLRSEAPAALALEARAPALEPSATGAPGAPGPAAAALEPTPAAAAQPVVRGALAQRAAEERATAPGRAPLERELERSTASAAAPAVELAAPAERPESLGRGPTSAAPGLALEAGAPGLPTAERAEPQRASLASESGLSGPGAPTTGPLALSAPPSAAATARAPERAAQGPERPASAAAASRPDVALAAPPALARTAASAPAPEVDLLAGLDRGPRAEPAAPPGTAGPSAVRLDASAERARAEPRSADAPLARAASDAPEVRAPERLSWEHTPYENRRGEEKARALKLHGGDQATEAAVARGLAYLASVQQRDGAWGRSQARDEKYGQIAVGKTGLVLLAFLGAGHTHRSGSEYQAVVQRAVAYLTGLQDTASGHFGDAEAYGHGIATYALAECLAMTGDPALRAHVELAVRTILAQQNTERDPRLAGGWNYFYPDGRQYDRWPRTAITAWQVMALESARLSGLSVPDEAFAAAERFLVHARDDVAGHWRYNHDTTRYYATLPASTPAGMFALSLLGADLTGSDFDDLRRFVLERKPNGYRYVDDDQFVRRGTGNLYFWYYGTLAMFRAGGASWASWNEAMKRTLLPAQAADGSWQPIDPYARYARDDEQDKSYTTALCVLSLEIYYRYFLPLLKVR